MVVGGRKVQLHTDSNERLILRISKSKDVIDMGAPHIPHRRRVRNSSSPQRRHANATSGNINEGAEDTFADEIDLESTLGVKTKHRAGGRRRSPSVYTPNPRLYPQVQESGKSIRQEPLTPKLKPKVKKQVKQRAYESPIRHRHKRIVRSVVPNPRLYKAPPNRPRVPPAPPLNPLPSWSPPPKFGPQETASQIALHLSQRTIIPFREYLPPAAQPAPVKKRLGKKSKAAGLRHKKLTKSRPKTERVVNSRAKTESENWRPKSTHREELLAEQTPFNSPPGSPLRHSVLKISNNPPSLDTVPFQSYAISQPKRYVPRSNHFRHPAVVLGTNFSKSSIQADRAHTPPTLAELPSMASTPQSSHTPEDGSDGNDSMSAPSEYLAEFLSAIMSRKYAEALKYCRLILHYEPQNSTARSFYPILRHKLGQDDQDETALSIYGTKNEGRVQESSNSESASGSSGAAGLNATRNTGSPDGLEDLDETSGDSDSDAADYLASLSLDSSAKSSRCHSPAICGTDSGSEGSAEAAGVTAAAASWLADDNGNPHTRSHKPHHADDHDDENDNAASSDHTLLLKDPMLRQLRAQFACSIK